jgi:hypothetical protein
MRPLVVMALLSALAMPAGGQAPPEQKQGTASCMVKIEFDPNVLPLDWNLVHSLLNTSPIKDQAARDIGQASLVFSVGLGPGDAAPSTTPGVGAGYYRPGDPIPRRDVDMRTRTRSPAAPSPVRGSGAMPSRYLTGRTGTARGGLFAAAQPPAEAGLPAGVLLGRLELRVPDKPDEMAERLMVAVSRRLEQALEEMHETWLKRAAARVNSLEAEAARVEKVLKSLQQEHRLLSSKAGRTDLSRSSVRRQIVRLEELGRELAMEVTAGAAEIQALEKEIAEIGKNVAASVRDDPIAAELEKIVEYRKAEHRRLKEMAPTAVTARELTDTEAKIAESRVQLLRRREEVTGAAGGNRMETLNRVLADKWVRHAEQKARLASITGSLDEFKARNLLAMADESSRLEPKLNSAEEAYDDLAGQKANLARQIRTLRQPAVTVVGSTTPKGASGGTR